MTKSKYFYIHYAVFSGLAAATASTFGKLCWLPTLQEYYLLRIIFFACMITCNGAVWTLFVKALQDRNSSLRATVISSTSNYVFSVIIGFNVFGEVASLYVWLGMILILSGLSLLLSKNNNHVKTILLNKDK
ncbi:hypothetical protein NQ315_005961 [Exocentrus adspersus]|uniref:EamA domain-containing protein n=1 Tax=Exocentrus adspersus TaxID=1586481 RepID=A0AAV8VB46_9CUCU|nr:hypothetical protein NQ315_005961 [Exocentrus adspersus]